MKFIFLAVNFLFISMTMGFSQTQKVSVVSADDEQKLMYSYIYINGKAFGATNKSAETEIPLNMLKQDDIISASYVGFDGGFRIYDGYNKEGYVIYMNKSHLQSVKIYTREETRKQFRAIQHKAPISRAGDFHFKFIIDIDNQPYCRGDFYHYFIGDDFDDIIRNNEELASQHNVEEGDEPSDAPSQNFAMHNRLYLEVPDSLERLIKNKEEVERLRKTIIPILQDIYYSASKSVATDPIFMESSGIKVTKVADAGRMRQFSLTREANGSSFDEVMSSLVYVQVDTATNNVRESSMLVTKRDGRIELKAIYKNFGFFRYPEVIEANFYAKNGVKYSMAIYDVKPFEREVHAFKKRNSVNIWDIENELMASQKRIGIRIWNPVAKIHYDNMVKEILSMAKMDKYTLREHLEMLSLYNDISY